MPASTHPEFQTKVSSKDEAGSDKSDRNRRSVAIKMNPRTMDSHTQPDPSWAKMNNHDSLWNSPQNHLSNDPREVSRLIASCGQGWTETFQSSEPVVAEDVQHDHWQEHNADIRKVGKCRASFLGKISRANI